MTTRLKIERVRKGLSQEELANQVFISRATISRIENGNSDADPEVKKRLAEILQISENDLFGDDATVTVPEAKKKPYDLYKVIYLVLLFASVLTVPYGLFLSIIALYCAVKGHYSKLIILVNVLLIMMLMQIFLAMAFNIYIIPPRITVS